MRTERHPAAFSGHHRPANASNGAGHSRPWLSYRAVVGAIAALASSKVPAKNDTL